MKQKLYILLVLFLLALLALFAHAEGLLNDFVSYDDGLYVYENSHVQSGLTAGNLVWAFESLDGGNWNPLVWISHMFVADVFGLNPAWHHFFNILLHTGNVVLFFLLLYCGTGALLRSALAAAFFATHPIHVESVAWISERKDVLSMFFALLTLLGYLRYTRTGATMWHSAAFVLMLLGLMAKSMLVTLPVLMLLLDFWPLQRVRLDGTGRFFAANRHLILEKMPFFVLSCCAAGLAVYAQKHGGALAPWQEFSVWQRLANVATSYLAYLGKALWPENLAALYPLRASIPLWKSLSSGLLLCLLTAAGINYARRFPYWIAGWLWYLVAFLPVIGIIQVGIQSMADRYAYLPFLGIYVSLAWAGGDLLQRHVHSGRGKAATLVAVCLLLAVLVAGTRIQTGYWRNGESLFVRALAVTQKNYRAHRALAEIYTRAGASDEASKQLRAALEVRSDAYGYRLLVYQLMTAGKTQEALEQVREGLKLFPESVDLHKLLGVLLYRKGEKKRSAAAFAKALDLRRNDGEALRNLRVLVKELTTPDATSLSPENKATK